MKIFKVNYFSNSIVPSSNANSVHVTKMADAIKTLGFLEHFFIYRKKKVNIKEKYNLKNKLNYKFYFLSPAPVFTFVDSILTLLRSDKRFFTYGRNIKVCLIHLLFNRKVIFETHQPLKYYTKLEKFLFFYLLKKKKIKHIICISQALKNIIKKEVEGYNLEIYVLHDSANLNKFSKKKYKKNLNKIGYSGSLLDGRGIEIISNLAFRLPNIEFHIAGGSNFEINNLKKKNPNNIFFHGFLDQKKIERFQASMNILLAPYQKNTKIPGNKITSQWMSPLKIFEYMASGTPFIASDLPVLREVLKSEYNCILCKPDDLLGWEKAILKILENSKLAERISKNSQKDIQENYSWEVRARKLREIFKKIY